MKVCVSGPLSRLNLIKFTVHFVRIDHLFASIATLATISADPKGFTQFFVVSALVDGTLYLAVGNSFANTYKHG